MGTLEWLILQPESGHANDVAGTFKWTKNRYTAGSNAYQFYRDSEGIDIRNGYLYFFQRLQRVCLFFIWIICHMKRFPLSVGLFMANLIK